MLVEKKITIGINEDKYRVYYESEIFDGELGDTTVIFEGDHSLNRMFIISGNDIVSFNQELKSLFNKYKI